MSAGLTGSTTAVVQKLCDTLQAQRDALALQIAALRAIQAGQASEVTAELLLTLYLCMPSARHVAEFAKAQDWRVPGAKGPRRVLPEDVYALVQGQPSVLAPCGAGELLQMARAQLGKNGGYTGWR